MYKSVAAGYLRSEGRGLVFVLILFVLALAAPSFGALLDRYRPVSHWLEVRDVHVDDALAGEDPPMHVDRSINMDFRGDYVAVVRREGEGGFSYHCAGAGVSDYHTDAVLPRPLALSWWISPARCDLGPGRYRVDTLWRIRTRGGPVRELRNRSNVFEIHPVRRP